jgi:hypothetical protein
MDNSEIDELLDEAQTLFERSETEVEAGLDVDDTTLLQLGKPVDYSTPPSSSHNRTATTRC